MSLATRLPARCLALSASFVLFGCSSSNPSPPSPSGSDGGGDARAAGDASPDADAATLADAADGADGASAHDGSADSSPPPDAASASDGGDAGIDAATDGGGSDAGTDSGTSPPPPPPPPPATCSPTAAWGTGTLLAVSSPTLADELDAVTPDELSIAWTVGSGSTAMIMIADRAATTDAFGAPQALAAGQFTADRVALSHDGLRLVVVNADAQGFSELTRTSRTAPGNTFGAAATGSYTNLNGALASGLSYGDPTLSADDTAFYYSIYGNGQTSTIYRTARLLPTDPWPNGGALAPSSGLAAQGSLRRRPTAIASDEQTLFFWDEVTGTERAAWLDDTTGVFDMFVDLGTRSMAAPNAACTSLYYSAAGASSVDLFVAPD